MRITEITGLGAQYPVPGTAGRPDGPNEIRIQETQPDSQSGRSQENREEPLPSHRTRRPAHNVQELEDFSLTFHKEETFDYIGSEKDPARLDVEKALSDMRRDSVLQEYQYFVGTKPGLSYDAEAEGTFFLKE